MKNTKKKAGLALALALSLGALAPQATYAAEETNTAEIPSTVGEVSTEDANSLENNDTALGLDGAEEKVVDEEITNGETGESYVDEEGIIIDEIENDEPSTDEELSGEGSEGAPVANGGEETPSGEEKTTTAGNETPTGSEETPDNEKNPDTDKEGISSEGNQEDLIDEDKNNEEDNGDAQKVDASVLKNEIGKLEEKLTAGAYTEESKQKAEEILVKAKALLESGEFSDVDLATQIAELQIATEGLIVVPETNDNENNENSQVNPDTSKSDDDKRDMKPSDLEGKKPGEGEEWVDDDYVDSNKTPAKSLDELKKDPNAVEVENKKDNGTNDEESKKGTKQTTVTPSVSDGGIAKSGGHVNAQTGGGVSIGVASILAAATGAYSIKRKK